MIAITDGEWAELLQLRASDRVLREQVAAHEAREERVRALADEWDMRGREAERYINRAHHTEIHEVMAEARWFPERAAELRAELDELPA